MQKQFTDQMQRTILIEYPPQRIISLVPSQTELLYYLGLDKEIAGQTLFCIHPSAMHKSKPIVGGTKNLHFDKINQLKPGLIIGNKEENEQGQIEELAKHYPVWMSDIKNLDDALDMIKRVGELVERNTEASDLILRIQSAFSVLEEMISAPKSFARDPAQGISMIHSHKVAYLIWREPFMAAGGDTFINDMLTRCGLVNVFESMDSRYPTLTKTQLIESGAEWILLSSEPYPFREKHRIELSEMMPATKIRITDGEMFSWYGSRLIKSPDYMMTMIREMQKD